MGSTIDLDEEKWERSAFAHYEKEWNWNERPYPSWWPNVYANQHGINKLEVLYGFPYLSFWELDAGYFKKFPPIHLETCSPLNKVMLDQVPQIKQLAELWLKSSPKPPTKEEQEIAERRAKYEQTTIGGGKSHDEARPPPPNWKDIIGYPGIDFIKNGAAWASWMVQNIPDQLNFFGVPFGGYEKQIFHEKSKFFTKPLIYYPGKWILMVTLSLVIHIVHLVEKHPDSPFIPWKINLSDLVLFIPEPSSLGFPIQQYVVIHDEMAIRQRLRQIRGAKNQTILLYDESRIDSNYNPFTQSYDLELLLCFKKLWEEKIFTKLTRAQLSLLLSQPFFRILFVNMTKSIKKYQNNRIMPLRIFYQYVDHYSIETHTFLTLNSYNDLMLWVLSCMYIDFKSDSIFQPILEKQEPKNEIYKQFQNYIDEALKIQEQTKIINEAMDKGQAVVTDKKSGQIISIGNEEQEGTEIEPPESMRDPKLKTWLNNFRVLWRKSAEWHFLDIGTSPWPNPNLQNFFLKDTYEYQVVNYIMAFLPRRLRVPKWEYSEWTRKSAKWNEVFTMQYQYYLLWVEANVKVQHDTNWPQPGNGMKDPTTGELIRDSRGDVVINSYPDLGIMDENDQSGVLYNTLKYTIPFIHGILTFFEGSDITSFFTDIAKEIWNIVLKVLKELLNIVKPALPSLALIGAVVVGGLLAYDFVSTKVEKLASS